MLIYATERKPAVPQTWTNTYHLYMPGEANPDGETGPIEGWTEWVVLLNRLGAEGWELAAGSIMDTTIVASTHGWTQVGIPVRQGFTFKREARHS
ncbi:hypothetical protein Dvina_16920 [Dactylosporangium vinaceum]|uniref:hypothetical protein n=1 Tax=Dactylosporangium vinaceum TaxID=53362 RepID=UPI001CA8845F|nr:hypothetical protein [Dactylosporangium vinaceum]UAB99600.1 hypothetical protein Dvina_16920 [Dactylosporangium vinaceum]